MNNSINIVELIERNPLTRLSSNNYFGRLVDKIRVGFTEDQQHLFLANFFCYLNYDTKTEFVISLEDVWKWTGFSRKDPAKRLLEKCLTINIDYIVKNSAPPNCGTLSKEENIDTASLNEESKNLGCIGLNKETILLTVNAFKKFCLKANTKKADQIHDYYIKLEQLIQETVIEENEEIKQKLLLKENEIVEKDEKLLKNQNEIVEKDKKISHLSKYVIRKFNTKFKAGNCVYFVRSTKILDNFKIGSTCNINDRLADFNTGSPECFEIIELFFTEFNRLLEKSIKEIFGKYRVSVNCEWYEMSVIKEIKNYIVKQIVLYNEYKIYSEINTINEIINKDSIDLVENSSEDSMKDENNNKSLDQDLINHQEEMNTVDQKNFSENTNNPNQVRNKIPIYTNEKICTNCHENLNHKFFFFIDKNNRLFSDQCISCYEKENGKSVKQCSRCVEIKDKTEFIIDKSKKDGLTYECKACRKDFMKEKTELFKEKNSLVGKKECISCREYRFFRMFYTIKIDNENEKKYSDQCKDCFCKQNGNHKQCFSCKEIKKYIHFDNKSSSGDGLETYCKACKKTIRDKIRNEKRELLKDKDKKQCIHCEKHLKFNMFFKKNFQENNIEYFDQCMDCYLPESLQCNKCHEIKLKSK
jgi:hypothetical protein